METRIPPNSSGISRNDEKKCVYVLETIGQQ